MTNNKHSNLALNKCKIAKAQLKAIKSIKELKNLASQEDGLECCISLAGGLMRSSKHIWHYEDDGTWCVIHEIDDSELNHNSTEDFVKEEENIIQAIDMGVLFPYTWSNI